MTARRPETPNVAERAYTIWEEEGRPHGRDRAHWERAEQELAAPEAVPEATSEVAPEAAPDAAPTPEPAAKKTARARKPQDPAAPKPIPARKAPEAGAATKRTPRARKPSAP